MSKGRGRRILFSTVSNTPYAFHETITCTDTSLIYCIVCDKCGKLYIGLTSNSLKVRFRAHWHSSETRKLIPLYRHFARKSHNFLRDHRIVSLEHCEPDALAEREAYWISVTSLTYAASDPCYFHLRRANRDSIIIYDGSLYIVDTHMTHTHTGNINYVITQLDAMTQLERVAALTSPRTKQKHVLVRLISVVEDALPMSLFR